MKTRIAFHSMVLVVLSCVLTFPADADEPQGKLWIIDPHTHFKSAEQIAEESKTTKHHPQNTLGHVVTAEDYRSVADRLGIQSTVVVEAVGQEHPQFNDWVLEQAESDLISGYIARTDLASDDFLANHRRYQSTGYLRGYRFRRDELQGYLENDAARSNLQLLEREGMVVDLLVNSAQSDSVTRLAREYPNLTIVIDHCFGARLQNGKVTPEWTKAVQDCGKYPNVHCKLSSILNFYGTAPFTEQAPADVNSYEPILQTCFDAFGEDRVMFATNWGVCTHYGKVDDVVNVVVEFLKSQGGQALQKGMRDNSIRVFKIQAEHLR